MFRTILLTLFNLALPFLLRFIYLSVKRYLVRRENKKRGTDIKEPDWTYPWKIFLGIALGLTLLMIMIDRFVLFEKTDSFVRDIPKSEIEYK